MNDVLQDLTRALAEVAPFHDRTGVWPEPALERFRAAGGWRWPLPAAYGGDDHAPAERLAVYVALARGDMSTALYVTQHDGAVDLLLHSDNTALKDAWLPRVAAGEALGTIGYSQLTTSHQGGEPALRARLADGEVRLDGFMPWVTGARHVDFVVAGAVMPDGGQVLLLLPLATDGVRCDPAPKLLALDSSQTSVVHCDGVRLDASHLIAGPSPNVLAQRSVVRRLAVSATGVGLVGAIADLARELVPATLPDDAEAIAELAERQRALEAELHRLGRSGDDAALSAPVDELRCMVNDLLVRAAGVVMVLAKGTGFTGSHPAQRLAREALFFCVWSAPPGIRSGTLRRLLNDGAA